MPRGKPPKTTDFETERVLAEIDRSFPDIDRAFQSNKKSPQLKNGGTPLGFEAKLWAAADAMRNNMDAAEYKHVVLGLIFLKYISDAFQERHQELEKEAHANPEDRDEYTAENVFWVPKAAR